MAVAVGVRQSRELGEWAQMSRMGVFVAVGVMHAGSLGRALAHGSKIGVSVGVGETQKGSLGSTLQMSKIVAVGVSVGVLVGVCAGFEVAVGV